VLTFVAVAATEAGINPGKAFFLVSILNGASILGRFVSGFLGDRFGPLNMMIPFMTAAGSLSFGRSIEGIPKHF
jgi:MFS transporter, MCT family, solute carrier family 16 (monocarboxylic acid transporters), member 10